MSTTTQPTATVRARVDRRGRISLIWLIPLITALIGGWIAWDTISKRGPTITITFQSGEGLQAGQSRVKHKDVDLGQVTGVRLSDDASHVMVTVEMKRDAARFLTQGAKFWVVTPRLFAGSISGLDTLISGAYIELLPAATAGPAERRFAGLEEPPVLTENIPGRTFLLHAERIGSVSVGSPVFFRGLNVGTVLGWDVGNMARDVTIHAFVHTPYDQYVHNESRFWNASGVSVRLGAQGIKVQLDSIKALLLGGIAFDTPTPALQSPISTADRAFTLYADEQAANNAAYRRRIPMVGYFTGSVAGVGPGSPVTFRGLRIGEVTAVDLEFDPKTYLPQTPIHFEIEPERFGNFQLTASRGTLTNAQFLVQHGMRAQLQSSSLLTGQTELALDFFPDAKPAEIRTEGNVIVVPTVPGQFADLNRSVSALLAKLNQMPFEQIGQNLNALLAGATNLTNGPEIKDAMQSLTTTLATTDALMKQLDAGATPALRRLPEIAASLQAMLANTNKLVASTDAGYGDNSKFHRDLNRAMGQLTDMMQSLRELADLLTRHPEALIRGRTDRGMQ